MNKFFDYIHEKRDSLVFLVCIFAAVALFFVNDARAVDFELGAGRSLYQETEHGTWWQNGREHHIENHTNSFNLGLTDMLTDNIRWRVGYMNLGSQHLWSIDTSDPDYDGEGCMSSPCAQNAIIIAKGHVEGYYFTLAPEYRYKDVKFFVEGGFWLYQAHSDITLIDQSPTNQVIRVFHKKDDEQANWVAGFGMEYKNTQLAFMAYRVDSSGEWINHQPAYRRITYNISLRHHF